MNIIIANQLLEINVIFRQKKEAYNKAEEIQIGDYRRQATCMMNSTSQELHFV